MGFKFDPEGQVQSCANSGMLANGPFTRNRLGECEPVNIWNKKKQAEAELCQAQTS